MAGIGGQRAVVVMRPLDVLLLFPDSVVIATGMAPRHPASTPTDHEGEFIAIADEVLLLDTPFHRPVPFASGLNGEAGKAPMRAGGAFVEGDRGAQRNTPSTLRMTAHAAIPRNSPVRIPRAGPSPLLSAISRTYPGSPHQGHR